MKASHVVAPSDKGLFQNIVGEDRAEAVSLEQDPLGIDGAFDPRGMCAHRLLVTDKSSLKAQIHPATAREEGEHRQGMPLLVRLRREGGQFRFTDQIGVGVVCRICCVFLHLRQIACYEVAKVQNNR